LVPPEEFPAQGTKGPSKDEAFERAEDQEAVFLPKGKEV